MQLVYVIAGLGASLWSCRELVHGGAQGYTESRARLCLGVLSAVGGLAAGAALRGAFPNGLSDSREGLYLAAEDIGGPATWISRLIHIMSFISSGRRGVRGGALYTKQGAISGVSGPCFLIAVTGSVAAVKIPELVLDLRLLSPGCSIKILASSAGCTMLSKSPGYNKEAWDKFRFAHLD